MAYNKQELEEKALEVIKRDNLFFHNDVWPLLGISERTYFNYEMQNLQSIKDALTMNKIKVKNSMRAKWHKSDNATLQISLYKLVADEDERQKLSMNYTDITSKGEKVDTVVARTEEILGKNIEDVVNNIVKKQKAPKTRRTGKA